MLLQLLAACLLGFAPLQEEVPVGFDPAARLLALAREAYAAGELGAAHDHLGQALEEAPGEPEIRLLYARVLNDLGRGERAISVLEPALASAATSAWMLVEMGRARELVGDPAGAESSYRKALAASAHCGEARLRLGDLLLRGERVAEAREVLVPLVEQAPDEPAVLVLRARVLEAEGRTEEAVTLLRARLEAGAEDAVVRMTLAHLLFGLGRNAEAWQVAEPLLDTESDPDRLVFLATLARGNDKSLEAITAIGLALAAHPDHPEALRELYEIVEHGEALRLRLAQHRTVAHPEDLHAWKELLELHIEKARFDAFDAELARVPAELRSAASLRLLEARVLRRTGQIDVARQMLLQLCREEAEPRAFYELGLLEYGRGELEAACAAFQRGAEGRWAADAHFNRAVCLERLGRYREAAEAQEAAVRERAELKEAWLQLGNLRRFRLGEADLAREAYQRYLQLGGDDPEVRRFMEGAR